VRLTLDSNVLVYALDANTPDKHRVARRLMVRAAEADAVLTVQAMAEFLSVIRRRYPEYLEEALAQAERWSVEFAPIPTLWTHVTAAVQLAQRHRLQLWDCVIWQVARSNGASIFVSEDLQDGFSAGGMTVLDPFNPANADKLARLLEK
jgi:predicted nucleic acid-binding protein